MLFRSIWLVVHSDVDGRIAMFASFPSAHMRPHCTFSTLAYSHSISGMHDVFLFGWGFMTSTLPLGRPTLALMLDGQGKWRLSILPTRACLPHDPHALANLE